MGILQARIREWVAMPSSRGSSQPKNQTQVSHVAGRFFLLTEPPGKPKNTGMGSLSLLQGNLSKPGIKLGSPALQAYSLPAELPGKPLSNTIFCSKKPEPLEEMVDSWAKSGKEQLSLDCLLFQKVRIETGSR